MNKFENTFNVIYYSVLTFIFVALSIYAIVVLHEKSIGWILFYIGFSAYFTISLINAIQKLNK